MRVLPPPSPRIGREGSHTPTHRRPWSGSGANAAIRAQWYEPSCPLPADRLFLYSTATTLTFIRPAIRSSTLLPSGCEARRPCSSAQAAAGRAMPERPRARPCAGLRMCLSRSSPRSLSRAGGHANGRCFQAVAYLSSSVWPAPAAESHRARTRVFWHSSENMGFGRNNKRSPPAAAPGKRRLHKADELGHALTFLTSKCVMFVVADSRVPMRSSTRRPGPGAACRPPADAPAALPGPLDDGHLWLVDGWLRRRLDARQRHLGLHAWL